VFEAFIFPLSFIYSGLYLSSRSWASEVAGQHTSTGSTEGKQIYISRRSGHSAVSLTGRRKQQSYAEINAQTRP